MTERQKQIYNLGLDHAARLHEDAAIQYERCHLATDAAVHRQWASNIRREYKRTDRPYSEYVKEA
jgi:hypothetical protein